MKNSNAKQSKKKVKKATPQLTVTGKGIPHDVLAQHVMELQIFKTLSDTDEILIYNPDSGIFEYGAEPIIKGTVEKILTDHNCRWQATRNYIAEVVGHVQRSTYIKREALNSKQYLLHLKNGVLDLRIMKLKPHNPEYLSTICIPITYDPSADCPNIRKFFSQIIAEKYVRVLEEIFGWCLDINSRIQKLIILLGEGDNGKSTFLTLVIIFLGAANCVAVTLHKLISDRFAPAQLFGKLANIYADLPSMKLSDVSILKMLTGGDTIYGEHKFQKQFYFVNKAKLIFSANILPVIEDRSRAIYRRLVVIKFPNTFTGRKRNLNLIDKLTTHGELSGLLNIALAGLKRLKKRGGFSYEEPWEAIRDKYQLMSEPVTTFVDECCNFDTFGHISKFKLYKAYVEFCKQKKIAAETKKGFGRIFKRLYVDYKKVGEQGNNWTGIMLKDKVIKRKNP